MIDTFSKFYYGHTVTKSNRFINFDEGGGELSAVLATGTYTLSEYIGIVQTAMLSAGALDYVVTLNRSTRLITITAGSAFDLLIGTGSQSGQSAFSLMGYTGADLTTLLAYTGNEASGFEYRPQFKMQSYVDKDISEQGISTVINKTSEGAVEIVTFGREQFYEMDIKFITSLPMDNHSILNNANGLQDAISFMSNIIGKTRFEFIPDVDSTNIFTKVILESTPSHGDGTGFKLRELFNQNLRDIYETGVLKLRVVT